MGLLLLVLLLFIVLLCVYGLTQTLKIGIRRNDKGINEPVANIRVKHPAVTNPIILAYIFTPIVIIIVAIMIYILR
ncbi:hypothetical protein [Longirhabdus pacifica]|uniref:hypothetical protein n=1 Tax=Longirhabdus pacifica TaxID=2305227 RepID=UPI001008BAFF|nr:hypothetical protein [Longirhabdus pacifica]